MTNPNARPDWQPPEPRRLRRSDQQRIIAGVCGGIAEYADVDATFVRLAFVAFTVLGGSGVLIYLVALVLMPTADGSASLGQRLLGR